MQRCQSAKSEKIVKSPSGALSKSGHIRHNRYDFGNRGISANSGNLLLAYLTHADKHRDRNKGWSEWRITSQSAAQARSDNDSDDDAARIQGA